MILFIVECELASGPAIITVVDHTLEPLPEHGLPEYGSFYEAGEGE